MVINWKMENLYHRTGGTCMNITGSQQLKLWVKYYIDGVIQTGLTDLKVKVVDYSGNTLLADTILVETPAASGEYQVMWTVPELQNTQIIVYYMKGTQNIGSEEYVVNFSDSDQGAII